MKGLGSKLSAKEKLGNDPKAQMDLQPFCSSLATHDLLVLHRGYGNRIPI